MKKSILAVLLTLTSPAAAAVSGSTAPVTLDGKTVLVLRSRLLSLSAEERAQRVAQRILKLADDRSADPERISVVEEGSASDVSLGDYVIMSVTDNDAKAEGVSRQTLAARNADTIKRAVAGYRRAYSAKSVALGLLYSVLLTALFLFAARSLNGAYRRLAAGFPDWAARSIKGVKLQHVEILPAERIMVSLATALKALRAFSLLLMTYFYLPILFSFFPWTQGYAQVIFGYVLHPVLSLARAVLDYIPNFFFVGVTFVCVHYFLRFLNSLAAEVQTGRISFPGFYPDWAMPTFQILRFVTWAFSLVIVFPYLPGSRSPAFKGVSVFLGVLFSLGSTSAISNAVAGLIITYMRPFKTGDRVKIVDTMGDVTEKGLLVTRVRTIKNVSVTIPNALVLGSHIINYSSLADEHKLILNTSVTIGYDVPWRKVHELLISAGARTEGVLADPGPFVLQTALNDCHVSYELNAYTDAPEAMAGIRSDMHRNIQDGFAEAGIEILSPAYAALRDANAGTLPGLAPQEKRPGAFRVDISK